MTFEHLPTRNEGIDLHPATGNGIWNFRGNQVGCGEWARNHLSFPRVTRGAAAEKAVPTTAVAAGSAVLHG